MSITTLFRYNNHLRVNGQNMEFIFVYITCKDRVEALNIGKAVVEARLAACANIIDGMDSIYWWNDELQVEKEAILIMKSRGDLLEELTKKVKSKHSYEVPCVVALPIEQGNQDYLNWLIAETKAKQISTNS
ncbi:divalent-cation tolerance protein CutA [Dolichospermum flos-aquae]|nr:divalent-cation tolerance protein CutA [Dolichospermum flos-aquae]